MRKKCPLLLVGLVFFLTSLLTAQSSRWEETPRQGIAVEDVTSASLVNLASLGVSNASGMGWSGYYDGKDNDNSFHVSAGWLSYNYRDFNNTDNHEIGLGFPVYEGFYLGTSLRWDIHQRVGFNIHMLSRPYPWLSLGVKGESLNINPWMDWGVGIRPLVWNNYWHERLTLFYDARVGNTGGYENKAAGLRFMPIDGLEFFGHWDFHDASFKTGLNLSWNRFFLGGEIDASGNEAGRKGNIQTFISLKKMPSLDNKQKILLIYDVAEIITDTPRLYAKAQDFKPDPSHSRSLFEFLEDMERIRQRSEIKALLFDRQTIQTSFSNIIEIEQSLQRLRDSGKKIYFYADSYNSMQYALAASVADGVFLHPEGSIDLTGFGVNKLYFKDLLSKYGINIYNFRSHKYKTAYDKFSESSMSSAEKEVLESVYGSLQNQLNRMINKRREGKFTIPLEELYQEGAWMNATRAGKVGLVDSVLYHDEITRFLDLVPYRIKRYSSSNWKMGRKWKYSNRPNIALIYAKGNIVMGEGILGQNIGADSLARALRSARLNPLIKSVVLRIDSGGGSALASHVVAREIALFSLDDQNKPIIISMGSTAASGAYMISAPGSKIFASPASITGSIGVITLVPDISGLLEILDIGVSKINTTESADLPSLYRPLSEKEETRIRDSVMETYDSFINLVALNRKMDIDAVDKIAQGRIWTGEQAVKSGLADNIGGLHDALVLAQTMIGSQNARIIEINPGNLSLQFPGVFPSFTTFFGKEPVKPLDILPEDLRDIVALYKNMTQYRDNEALLLMPYSLKELGLENSSSPF